MRLFEYVQSGGIIMYILVFLNIVGLSTLLVKGITLVRYKSHIKKWTKEILDDFFKKLNGKNISEAVKLTLVKDEIVLFVSRLESGLNTIKIIASIAPLLGLLGTVTGILGAFDVISRTGLEDPSSFAGGISLALITTVGGLIVAIPHFIGHNYLVRLIDTIETELEERVVPEVF